MLTQFPDLTRWRHSSDNVLYCSLTGKTNEILQTMAEHRAFHFENPIFWADEPPHVTPDMKKLYAEYAGVPETELVPHLKSIRERAYKKFNYPCIGLFHFAEFPLAEHPDYPEILQRLKSGQQLLDLGCCFGADIRKLVFDGAPAGNMRGQELHREFVDLGYELFRDKATLKTPFTIADWYATPDGGTEGRKFDLINASMIFHLFDRDMQIAGYEKAVRTLKQQAGSMVFGLNIMAPEAEVVTNAQSPTGKIFVNNEESFHEIVREVAAATGVKLRSMFQRQVIPDEIYPLHWYAIVIE